MYGRLCRFCSAAVNPALITRCQGLLLESHESHEKSCGSGDPRLFRLLVRWGELLVSTSARHQCGSRPNLRHSNVYIVYWMRQ